MAQVDKKTDLDPVLDQHDAGEDKIQSAGAGAGAPWPPTPEIDPAAERRLVRKIDIKIMPIAVLLYICNYLDRNSITTARENGFVDDLRLTSEQYSTALSILYVGYISLQIPSNLLMAKLGKPSVYLPVCVAAWGVVSGCTAAVTSFGPLLAVRLVLGMVECAFFPGMLFLLSKWYKRSEMATRTAILYSGSIISNAFSGLISAGILGGMEGKARLAGWRWLFIIEGAATVVIAVLAFVVLPDFPENSGFLDAEERAVAMRRMEVDAGEVDDSGSGAGSAREGLKLALTDSKTWVLALMLTTTTIGVGFNQFMPTLTSSLGFDHTVSLLLTAPIWFFAFLACLANGLHSDRAGERTFHIIAPLSLGIVGFIISAATLNIPARFFALFIEASSYAGYTCVLGWIAPSIPRPTYKRAAALAFINAFSQLGNISASYVWPKHWGPQYWQSNVISLSMFVAAIALALFHRATLVRENRRIQKDGELKPESPNGAPYRYML